MATSIVIATTAATNTDAAAVAAEREVAVWAQHSP